MGKIQTVLWEIEPHTEIKHEILRRYLAAWVPILSKFGDRILYVDGFSGPGEYIGGKDGSPIIAIKTICEHKTPIKSEVVMLFIEADKSRYDYLKQKVSGITKPVNVKCDCVYGEFSRVMGSILENLEKQGRLLAPSFVFIDPFGSDDWKKFKDVPNRESMLIAHYRDQLEKYAGIKYVRTFTIVNRHNKSDYYLVFGTNSETGLSKMKDAMWKVDPSGSFRFSDATYNSSQPLLFEDIPDFNRLNKSIIEKYKGLEVLVDDLESFVNIETSFRKEHLRTVLKKMEKATPLELIVLSSRKKKYTYPSGCKVKIN